VKYAKLMKDLDFDANPRGKSVSKRESESELMTTESDDCLELVQATNQTKKFEKTEERSGINSKNAETRN